MSGGSERHSRAADEARSRRFQELDCVRLLSDLPEQGLTRGETGTIVHVFASADAYLVEFIDEEDGVPRAEVELTPVSLTEA